MCHCEARSDEAIPEQQQGCAGRLLRCARNDKCEGDTRGNDNVAALDAFALVASYTGGEHETGSLGPFNAQGRASHR
jgi:hypothetical protein